MQSLKKAFDILAIKGAAGSCMNLIPACGIKYFAPPINYDDIEIPEKAKLRFMEKVPMYPSNIKAPKMQKRLRYLRGPELLHNTLQYKQFGIVAEGGGRLRWEHLEIIRLGVARRIDAKRMFAVWRVDPPWQPITRKGQGQRMGGGKGAIDHYITPIKAGRIIVELAGKLEYKEACAVLNGCADKLPFKARVISQEMMDREEARNKSLAEQNSNAYTLKYVIQNNMGGCHTWLSPFDHRWYGKHL